MALQLQDGTIDPNAQHDQTATTNYQQFNQYRVQQQLIIVQQNEDAERVRIEAERRHAEILDMATRQARAEMGELEQHADAQHRARIEVISDRMDFVVRELQQQLLETKAALRGRTAELDQAAQDAHTLRMHNLELEARGNMVLESETRLRTHLEQSEFSLANLRVVYDQNRETQLEFLGNEFREQMQYEENMFTYAMHEEESACDVLIQELAESNQRLMVELDEAKATATASSSLPKGGAEHQQAVPMASAPPPGLNTAEASPPQGGAACGNAHVTHADLPNPLQIPESMKGLFERRPQRFNLGASTPVSQAPNEVHEAIAKALKDFATKDETKPKTKEAETVKLPDFPSAETYRSWKTAVREAVRAASDHPDEAFAWIQQVYAKGASLDSLNDVGKFLTLDTKILAALSRVAKGELARQILNYKETEATCGRAVRGRQVLLMFEAYFKTNEEVGSLYSVEDLLKVALINDDLATFVHNWDSVIAGLSHPPDETTLRDIFLRELRKSHRLKYDLDIYDRAREGTPEHTYKFLMESIKNLLTRERIRKNRDKIAKAHGAKYGAPAPPTPAKPSAPAPSERRQPSRGRQGRQVCMLFQKGKCKFGERCKYEHTKDPKASSRERSPNRPKSGSREREKSNSKDTSNIPCVFYAKGTCRNGDKCKFLHKDKSASPSVPAKAKARAPSPAKRRPSRKKRTEAKAAACCVYALAARKGEPDGRHADTWRLDEKSLTLSREHVVLRNNYFIPQSCPVPAWRIKSVASITMKLKTGEERTLQYNWKTCDKQAPLPNWTGVTSFKLKPKDMSVCFERHPEIHTVESVGDGWKFVPHKRKCVARFKTNADCPMSDPGDLQCAVIIAQNLEASVYSELHGEKTKCKHRCCKPDFACRHCAAGNIMSGTAAPARKELQSLDIIADTGSEEDLISSSDLRKCFEGVGRKVDATPVNLHTANGIVEASSRTEVEVPSMNGSLEFVELPDTPPVCSVGKKCMQQGYGFYWPPGQVPYFVKPDGQKLTCTLRGNVPVFSSIGNDSGHPAAVAHRDEGERMAPTCSLQQDFHA